MIADSTPDAFVISASSEVDPGSVVTSSEITPVGYDTAARVVAEDATVSVNGGAFGAEGIIEPGQSFRLRTTAPASWAATENLTASVGDSAALWSLTTRSQDTTPDAFALTDFSGVEPSSTVTSDPIIPSGYDGPISVSVDGGWVSVEGGEFVSSAMISEGQSFVVRALADEQFGAVRRVELTVGSVTETWQVTTRDFRGTPDPFVVANAEGVEPDEDIVSEIVTVSGFDGVLRLSVLGGRDSQVAVIGERLWQQSHEIRSGQSFRVMTTAPNRYGASSNVTVRLGDSSVRWTVTTQPRP